MSGDQLGADLIKAIKARYPQARFVGIGGPAMIAQGCSSQFPLDRLSVMGIFAVLGRLKELLHIRSTLKKVFLEQPIDLFIGIDSPDFNLPLEGFLKRHNIPTVHYVSPSVWAWRQGRIRKIRQSVDLMLTLLPFEADFYHRHQVPVQYVGHPFASVIDVDLDNMRAKRHWGFSSTDTVIAVLPGSRGGELKHMAPLFLEVIVSIYNRDPSTKFIVPLANPERRQQFESYMGDLGTDFPIQLVDGCAREVMAGSDFVLATSGTITLEAMLLKRPMVVAYRWGRLTHAILAPLVKIKYIALPNLLADKELVPEFLQEEATVYNITSALYQLMNDRRKCGEIQASFKQLHNLLNCNASEVAADAIFDLLGIAQADAPAKVKELCKEI